MSCRRCGRSHGYGGVLCKDCESKYLRDISSGKIPAPITTPEITYLPEDWARVERMRAEMKVDGKSEAEIEEKVNEYAAKRQGEYDRGRAVYEKNKARQRAILEAMNESR